MEQFIVKKVTSKTLVSTGLSMIGSSHLKLNSLLERPFVSVSFPPQLMRTSPIPFTWTVSSVQVNFKSLPNSTIGEMSPEMSLAKNCFTSLGIFFTMLKTAYRHSKIKWWHITCSSTKKVYKCNLTLWISLQSVRSAFPKISFRLFTSLGPTFGLSMK